MNRRSVPWFSALAVASALTLTGCVAGEREPASTPTASTAAFASADVMFAMMMIPHHQQAVAMSDALLARDGIDEPVRDLAEAIKAAQQPEIELMETWLDDWTTEFGDTVRMTPGDGMMMAEMDTSTLEEASGADAERVFLEEMIVHHEGAIEMSQALLDSGENPEALALARTIITDQTDEIAYMRDVLSEY